MTTNDVRICHLLNNYFFRFLSIYIYIKISDCKYFVNMFHEKRKLNTHL